MKFHIPVVFSTDNNFLIPTAVSITSMLAHAHQDTFYHIYILIDELFDMSQKGIIDNLQKGYQKCRIEWRLVDRRLFSKAVVMKRSLTIHTFYKLIIADILEEYDKCIYLDGDIVVENDLRQMYLVDLENDYLAAVKQDYHLFSKDFIERTISKLEVDNLSGYFFAGDIVMNLKKMREDKMTERFLEALGKGYLSEDQDILYKFCREKVKYISLTYTFCNRYINESKFLSTDIYSREEIEDALQYPVIIHFAGGNMKPWNNLRCKAAEKWWNYAKNVLEDETFKEIYDIAKKKTEERDFDYLISGLDKTRNKVIIFGFSMIEKMLCDDLMKFGYNVVSFFDNNESFWGKKYNGCFVEKPKKINDENRPNFKVIIAAQGRLNVILDQLSVLGYEESAIIKYAAKNAIYYMGLDEKFYEHELREMTRRECGREDGDIKEKLKRNFSYLNEKYYLDFWNVIEER